MTDRHTLQVDEFVRSINVNKDSPHALFLGAGASLSSGVPSAGKCVGQWKRDIYVTNNPTMKDLVAEQSIVTVQNRIERWLRENGHWPREGEDDYCFFIERCHKIAEDRRKFFEPWIRKANPHVGYQLLVTLAEAQVFKSVWTTNFDTLVSRAVAAATSDLTAIDVGIDCSDRAFRLPSSKELICVSLHGDYRYDQLKNTVEELQSQEQALKNSFVNTLASQSLVVLGYSGRDASVMDAIKQAICSEGNTKLYWCGYGDGPSTQVKSLIEEAISSGRQAFYIPNADFDDVMIRLATICVEDRRQRKAIEQVVGSSETSELPKRLRFGRVTSPTTGLIKSNAWPIRCPSEVFAFDIENWPEEKPWKWLTEFVSDSKVVAVPFRSKVLAMGTRDEIKGVFEDQIKGNIERVPISDKDLSFSDGAMISLLKQAVIGSIAQSLGLCTDQKYKVWEKQKHSVERDHDRSYDLHRCMELDLRFVDGKTYLTVDPTYHIETADSAVEQTVAIKKKKLGWQHNSTYNADLDYWRRKLSKDDEISIYDFPCDTSAFEFRLTNKPAFASLSRPDRREHPVPEAFQALIHHKGVVCDDPNLCFGKEASWNIGTDKMPLRGVTSYGPFDRSLNLPDSDNSVKLTVVCPQAESGSLENFLEGITRSWESTRGVKEDYLVPYRGFEKEFRVPIEVPKRSDRNWFVLPELQETNAEAATRELAGNINDAIKASASLGRTVVLVLTPERWDRYRRYENDEEIFDVHDYVKAFAAQRAVATQFLKQEKMGVKNKCRFWWWFAVALYTKSLRTPWILEGLDTDTAYVGLGYAIDRKEKAGSQVVLGCSHLYNSQGQGLDFRLSKIEDPIIRGRNAFLPFDDARRMGETIRSLYWDFKRRLPDRVVIHKLFPFTLEEKKGLWAGLEGVKELDLLEINEERRLRYVNSKVKNNKIEIDGFPVRRGTVIRLSDFEALLYVHGATDAVKQNYTYFQGKRRIPGPLLIRRHSGTTPLSVIAREILGLSKMDWNSGDLYSQLPVTIYSSKRIARIGRLLERFGSDSFDFRLFM